MYLDNKKTKKTQKNKKNSWLLQIIYTKWSTQQIICTT